jgi:hypothetical protein
LDDYTNYVNRAKFKQNVLEHTSEVFIRDLLQAKVTGDTGDEADGTGYTARPE